MRHFLQRPRRGVAGARPGRWQAVEQCQDSKMGQSLVCSFFFFFFERRVFACAELLVGTFALQRWSLARTFVTSPSTGTTALASSYGNVCSYDYYYLSLFAQSTDVYDRVPREKQKGVLGVLQGIFTPTLDVFLVSAFWHVCSFFFFSSLFPNLSSLSSRASIQATTCSSSTSLCRSLSRVVRLMLYKQTNKQTNSPSHQMHVVGSVPSSSRLHH